MLESEIRALIAQGEGANLEFKRDDMRPEDLAKEIVSFANMHGGYILLGVEDNGEISGINRKNLQTWVIDTVIGKHIHPYILPNYKEISIEGSKIAVLNIPMGTAKPYMRKHKNREDIYVRYGDICQLASREQQARLFGLGGLVSVEKFPVHGSVVEELDERRYQQYFIDILEEQNISDWQKFLTNRSFLVGENDSLYCSYFAYALFAKNPQLRLPQAGARVTVFNGQEQDYTAPFDESFNVPLVELRNNDAKKASIEKALHGRIIDSLRPYISHEYMDNGIRKRYWDYPQDVLRELFVNAFIHRDWTKQNYVRIIAYSDRLEVISPGSLPNGMTIEKIKYGEQSQRNPICLRIFRDYGYLEDRGMGIRRKVIPLMLQHTNKEPDFEVTEESFRVTLWKKEGPNS